VASQLNPFSRTTEVLGLWLLRFIDTLRRLGAFALITLGVVTTKFFVAHRVVFPIVQHQIARAGVRLLPIIMFIGGAMGFVIVGQTLSLLTQVGQADLAGQLMVTVIFREVAPLVAALVVLARVGTATVVELGTARALGEVESLEALGIDPIHYLVMPRVIGLTTAVFGLTVYLFLFTIAAGWVFAQLTGLPYPLEQYLGQIASALQWHDFVLLAAKTVAFGSFGSLIACYHGLAHPLQIEDVAQATTRTVAQSVVAFGLLDGLFLLLSLLL
jgi:phospholipid/cholesterol/gamma-HCH transport system permease protein